VGVHDQEWKAWVYRSNRSKAIVQEYFVEIVS